MPVTREFRVLPPDGRVRIVIAKALVEKGNVGQTIQIGGYGQDLRTAKRAEEAVVQRSLFSGSAELTSRVVCH